MELVFDLLGTDHGLPAHATTRTFDQEGGFIGRAEDCDWTIPDRRRLLSGHHAEVSWLDGAFHLTDTSSNGIQLVGSGARLERGRPHRIAHGQVYRLGDIEIRACLAPHEPVAESATTGPQPTANRIPDDAFLALDPLASLDERAPFATPADDDFALLGPACVSPAQPRDAVRIGRESLPAPLLVAEPPTAEPVPASLPVDFWARFGAALGMDLDGLDQAGREALAMDTARLLRHSVAHLQQALRTRSELKSELRLAQTCLQGATPNPLKHATDSTAALSLLLRGRRPGQLPADQAIGRAFRDLQAHQVALLAASRAALDGLLDQFAPERLVPCFEQERKPLVATAGSRWRAYCRLHRARTRDDEWRERLLARDFARTYEEQVRLIATLDTDLQG